MVRDASGNLGDVLDLPAIASKGRTGAGRIPLASDLRRALLRWSAMRRHPTTGPVICGSRCQRISAHAVSKRLSKLYRKAGLTGASSHSGRRTFATKLANKGLNAFQVQRAMRHADITTTKLYVGDAASDAEVG